MKLEFDQRALKPLWYSQLSFVIVFATCRGRVPQPMAVKVRVAGPLADKSDGPYT
jgi:hypothetical protein